MMMLSKREMQLELEKVLKTMDDTRRLVAILEEDLADFMFSAASIAFTGGAMGTAFAIVRELDRRGLFGERHEARVKAAWSRAIAAVREGADREVRIRLNALLASWPTDHTGQPHRIPAPEVLAVIVGSDAATVERILDADVLEAAATPVEIQSFPCENNGTIRLEPWGSHVRIDTRDGERKFTHVEIPEAEAKRMEQWLAAWRRQRERERG